MSLPNRSSPPRNLGFARILMVMVAIFYSTACIDQLEVNRDESFAPMCEESSDCDTAAGQICDLGTCWGGAPSLGKRFGALLIPPAEREDLVQSEISELQLSADGTFSSLAFAETILIRAQVSQACTAETSPDCGPGVSVGARIVVTRTSSLRGGPSFQKTLFTPEKEGPTSAEVRLPKDGLDYRITIFPENPAGTNGEASLIAPPLSSLVRADQDRAITFELGMPGTTKRVRGCVEDESGIGRGYGGLQVAAWGRFGPLAELERASATVATDASGCFELSVPVNMLDEFDFLITPPVGRDLPTLSLKNEFILDPIGDTDGVYTIAPLVMPDTGALATFQVPVAFENNSGDTLAGASLQLTTLFPRANQESRDITLSHSAEATLVGPLSGGQGTFEVRVFAGSAAEPRIYRGDLQTPPDSVYAASYRNTLAFGTAQTLPPINLARRGVLSGTLRGSEGQPIANAPISVRLSQSLRQNIAEATEQFSFDRLVFPTTTTDLEGRFTIRLDQNILEFAAIYDLDFTPPRQTSAPVWTVAEFGLQDRQISELTFDLPRGIFARGDVVDPSGQPVANAEMRVFQLVDESRCPSHLLACVDLAPRRATTQSDTLGKVSVILPSL